MSGILDAYLEVRDVGLVSCQFGELAHGVDADDALQGQVGLQCQPSSKVVGRDCDNISMSS